MRWIGDRVPPAPHGEAEESETGKKERLDLACHIFPAPTSRYCDASQFPSALARASPQWYGALQPSRFTSPCVQNVFHTVRVRVFQHRCLVLPLQTRHEVLEYTPCIQANDAAYEMLFWRIDGKQEASQAGPKLCSRPRAPSPVTDERKSTLGPKLHRLSEFLHCQKLPDGGASPV